MSELSLLGLGLSWPPGRTQGHLGLSTGWSWGLLLAAAFTVVSRPAGVVLSGALGRAGVHQGSQDYPERPAPGNCSVIPEG
jgi:hypothetical protein